MGRANEVLLRWPAPGKSADEETKKHAKGAMKVTPGKMAMKLKSKSSKIVRTKAKAKAALNMSARVKYTGKSASADYITKRCKLCSGKTVGQILGKEFKH